jgi:hypothetical protein
VTAFPGTKSTAGTAVPSNTLLVIGQVIVDDDEDDDDDADGS